MNVKRDVVVKILKNIEKRDGLITVEAVIKEAEKPHSLLHNRFEWDDTVAAHEWRKCQARQLINHYYICVQSGEESEKSEKRFFHVTIGEQDGYVNEKRVISEKPLYEQVLMEAVAGLRGWQSRYEYIKELRGVINEKKLRKLEANY